MKQPFVDLARQHTDVVFVHCDVERLTKLAQKYAATRIPTYTFFWNGVMEAEFAGASERKLRDVLQDCLDLGPLPKIKDTQGEKPALKPADTGNILGDLDLDAF